MEESWRRRERGAKPPVAIEEIGGGAGICTYSAAVLKLTESRAFLIKLLIGATFDVFIDSSGLHSSAPKSTAFVEALWRRREGSPVAHP